MFCSVSTQISFCSRTSLCRENTQRSWFLSSLRRFASPNPKPRNTIFWGALGGFPSAYTTKCLDPQHFFKLISPWVPHVTTMSLEALLDWLKYLVSGQMEAVGPWAWACPWAQPKHLAIARANHRQTVESIGTSAGHGSPSSSNLGPGRAKNGFDMFWFKNDALHCNTAPSGNALWHLKPQTCSAGDDGLWRKWCFGRNKRQS